MNRHVPAADYEGSSIILGVDVAREGDDASVIARRQGIVSFPFVVMRNVKSLEGAGRVTHEWSTHDADGCFVDNTGGFGGGWIDQLKALGRDPGAIHFAGEPTDRRYYNKRAEIHFLLAEWIKGGGALPNDPELVAELTTPTYTFEGDRLIVEPKEAIKAKLGRSPDKADALALTFSYPVIPKPRGLAALYGNKARPWDYDPHQQA